MSFEIFGLDEFAKEIDSIVLTTANKNSILEKAVEPLYSEIKAEADSFKQTGELSNSFKKKVKDGKAYVTSTKKHAFILEYSPKYGHAGYFSGAVEDAEDKVLDIIEQELLK